MATLQEALGAAAKATFCTLSAPVEKTLALGEEWYNNQNFPGSPSGPTPAGQGLRAARNVLCDEPPDDVSDSFSSPFTGGQCNGTIYSVTAQPEKDGEPFGQIRTKQGPGPIGYKQAANENGGSNARISNRDDPDWFIAGTSEDGAVISYRFDDVSVVSGPDDCGNPDEIPPEPYLPEDFTDTPDVTYTPPSGPDITIPVPIVFAPVQVDVNGKIIVPVELTFDTDVKVNATLDLSTGDFTIVQDIDITLPTPVDDPTVLPDPVGTPGNPPTEEEELENTIIGVYVKTIAISEAFKGNQLATATAGSDFYVPRLASVSFNCEILSADGLAWTEDIDVKYTDQVIPCPVSWGAKGVSVTEQPGVTVVTTLIRAEARRDLWLRSAGVI